MKKDSDLIQIGHAHKAHGLKGEFLWVLYNQASDLKNGDEVFLFPHGEKSKLDHNGQKFVIANIKHGSKTIVSLVGITGRNQVDDMLAYEIFRDRKHFPKLAEGEFYVSDLLALTVINTDGTNLGKIIGHYENGEQIILAIELQTREVVELPFVASFFGDINFELKTIVAYLPEYI